MVSQLTMNCRPTLSPYLNELHCAHRAHSINGHWTLYFPLLTVTKQKMLLHFHNITLGAITEAALLIAHSLSVEHIQHLLLVHVDMKARLCVYCIKNAHKQIALKPFMML